MQKKTCRVGGHTLNLFVKFLLFQSLICWVFSGTGTAGELTDLKNRLSEAEKKKAALENSLADAQTKLNGIKTGKLTQGKQF